MRSLLLSLLLTITFSDNLIAQMQKSAVRHFGPILCDSLQEIDQAYFDSHKRDFSILDTANIPPKNGTSITIPFGRKSLLFKDTDSSLFFKYQIAGVSQKNSWVLMEEFGPQVNHYYLINTKKHSIDTLIGYPHIMNDKVVCLEDEQTDWQGPLEIYQIKGGRFKLIAKGAIGPCVDDFRYYYCSFYLNEKNQLMSGSPFEKKYWMLKVSLF